MVSIIVNIVTMKTNKQLALQVGSISIFFIERLISDFPQSTGNQGVLNLNSQHMVVILIVFCALVFGMCASIAISCWSKIEERSQRKREYKLRRSREASMEVGLDRAMTITSLDRTCPNEQLVEQTSSSSGSRCRKIVTANAIRPAKPADVADEVDDNFSGIGYYDSKENGCYVPDLEMPSSLHHSTAHHHLVYPSSTERRPKQMQTQSNGGSLCKAQHLNPAEKYSPETPTPPQMMIGSSLPRRRGAQSPLVGDYYPQSPSHQRQQQQQQNQIERDSIRSSSDCSIPPPPPPPSLSHLKNRLQQQQQPQQYRTLPLDPSKLTDTSMLMMSDPGHQSVQYRHPQHTPRMMNSQMPMMIQSQHHPDCAQYQLNKLQQHHPASESSQFNQSSMRPGYCNRAVVQVSGTPISNRPSPMSFGSNGGDTIEMLNEVDVDGCIDEGDESGVGPSEQRSALDLNDEALDDDVLTENDIFPPSLNGPNSVRHPHYLIQGQSTLEEEDDSSVPLNSTNSNAGYASGQQTTGRPVYYRSEAIIELTPSTETNRQGVAAIR